MYYLFMLAALRDNLCGYLERMRFSFYGCVRTHFACLIEVEGKCLSSAGKNLHREFHQAVISCFDICSAIKMKFFLFVNEVKQVQCVGELSLRFATDL